MALREVLAACLVWHAKDPVHRSFHVDGNEVDRYLREGEVPVQATVFDRSQVGKIALAYVRCPEDFENLKWR